VSALFEFAARAREIADVVGLLLVIPALAILAIRAWWVNRNG